MKPALSLSRRGLILLAVAGILLGIVLVFRQREEGAMEQGQAVTEPARNPFSHTIGASGIVEAVRENVRIASPVSGLVTHVLVKVGDEVTTGMPLVQIDNRQALASVRAQEAQIPVLQARLREAMATYTDRRVEYLRKAPLAKTDVLSKTEVEKAQFAMAQAAAQVEQARAELVSAAANLDKAKTDLNILTIRAPREGTVLQVNVRPGEHTTQDAQEPLVLLGETKLLQVRADIDEQNASRFRPGAPAVAYVKGVGERPIPLQFVRVEPYVVPKESLTGLSTERVDTRVLQVIYAFRPPDDLPVYVGQQMDVFIEASPGSESKAGSPTAVGHIGGSIPADPGGR